MSQDLVLQQRDGYLLHLTLNRPDKKNALTFEMYLALIEAMQQAEQDESIRVLLLSGAGGSFTSGNDIAAFVAAMGQPERARIPLQFLQTLASFSKPIVAAVDGVAVGIGTSLLLHCDLVLASEEAIFQLPFTRLGLVPEGGTSLLLPQQLGHRLAFELLVEGDAIPAHRAAQLGLINTVLPQSQLLDSALRRAHALTRLAPEAVRQSKQMLKAANKPALDAVLVSEVDAFAARLSSPEAREAFQAFMEKRAPNF